LLPRRGAWNPAQHLHGFQLDPAGLVPTAEHNLEDAIYFSSDFLLDGFLRFFLWGECFFDGVRLADFFVDGHKGSAQLLVLLEGPDVHLCLAWRGWAGETLGHGLAIHFISKARVGSMAGIIGQVAVTRWTAAPASGSRDGARTEAAERSTVRPT
jgi:hypothetical protein